jgi:hypothetical protein
VWFDVGVVGGRMVGSKKSDSGGGLTRFAGSRDSIEGAAEVMSMGDGTSVWLFLGRFGV